MPKMCREGEVYDEGKGRCIKLRPSRRGSYFLAGYDEGSFAATVNLADTPEEVKEYYEEDRLGEMVGEIREHQVQMAGDISYDVGQPGGPTESQYEAWEEGFTEGFEHKVKAAMERKMRRRR